MESENPQTYTVFQGEKMLVQGHLSEVIKQIKKRFKADASTAIQIFSDLTGKEMDFDLRGTAAEILERLNVYVSPSKEESQASGPGRPKLGVIAREISLLPRHWEWLSSQTGGASATLRRLVEDAKKNSSGRDLIKQAQERAHKFMTATAGNLPGFEEALRALYAKNKEKFSKLTKDWPRDIIENHAAKLAAAVWTKS